jgi:DNA-binding response OmpR family regulator
MPVDPSSAGILTFIIMSIKILLIDDDRTLVTSLKRNLEMYEYEIVCAYDGKEAIERFYADQPDCVIMDVCMPNFDGDQVTMTFKGIDKGKKVPIIILSGIPAQDHEELSMRLGADAYLVKPTSAEVLHAKVQELVS